MFRIIINDREIQHAFNRLKQASSDLKAPMSDIGEHFLKRADDGFRNETDPWGVPWQPLKPKTIARKQKDRKILKVLQSTGLLRASFSYTADSNSVEIGTNRVSATGAPIAIFHQLGTRKMPARPMLPETDRLPPQDLEEVLAILEEHITGVF
ncbi:phage virion morphogenesis protein [Chroococcidiopsis sp.]|uniref:phage virion morphogenesis protein n=1 Tax=Chroococcidiopsis sp. TaxID=3088168 RepID=UPI003F348403